MIEGLAAFRDAFADYGNDYVLIGGIPTVVWFEVQGLTARATRDFDMVIFTGPGSTVFRKRLWQFIREGEYEHSHKDDGRRSYYRFAKPAAAGFPFMIELFSQAPSELELKGSSTITPIPADADASSLSAILMDDEYHRIVREQRVDHEGLSLLSPAGLILLKAKAWLDLCERQAQGEAIDSRSIKKHRGDVFKLATLLAPENHMPISPAVHRDLHAFLDCFPEDSPDWAGIRASARMGNLMPPPRELRALIVDYFPPDSV